MKKMFKNLFAISLVAGLVFTSCSNPESEIIIKSNESKSSQSNLQLLSIEANLPENASQILTNDFPINIDLSGVVIPSECGTTPFDDALNASIGSNLDQLGLDFYQLYKQVNQLYARFLDTDRAFFGANNEYTNYVVKRTRSLEKFWDMPNEITVRGQHNSTLGDRDKLAETFFSFYGNFVDTDGNGVPDTFIPLTLEEAYANADFLLAVNEASTFLIESPFLSFDGFATSNNLIVIGDGIVEIASDAGVEDKVVWSGILAHEWAHQIQFDNFFTWYPDGAADNAPEATRTTELEADFFTGFYLTHKRGATYNWKRTEDFLELFFNIGDCGFTSPGHHGTPLQRMEAARQGYLLAASAKKKGKILSADAVHDAFLNILSGIVN